MKIKIIENLKLDLSFLKDNLKSEIELKLVNPKAELPFDNEYWLNFFKLGNPTTSYLFAANDEIIGHCALQIKKESNSVWLCFVLVKDEYRGSGMASELIRLTEEYVKSTYSKAEYFLNVKTENTRAINFYKKNGFIQVSKKNDCFQMKKVLKL